MIHSFNRLFYGFRDRTLQIMQVFIYFPTLLVLSTGCPFLSRNRNYSGLVCGGRNGSGL